MTTENYEWRNPRHTPWGTYEVEINHEEAGWIPYHVTSNDEEAYGQKLWQELQAYTGEIAPSEFTIEQIADGDARQKRDQLLKESDWTQNPDVPESTSSRWVVYRQALRDITEQPGYPMEIVWPEPPQ
jgi:hypothetical protein